MRVNIYAEEMTDRVEFVTKTIDGKEFVGVRFYLYLPVTVKDSKVGGPDEVRGPFLHRDGDDDSSAVTFWGKSSLKETLKYTIRMLETHYSTATSTD